MTSVSHLAVGGSLGGGLGGGLGGEPAPVSFAEKIWRINWGLVLVLTAIAGVGFVALYSAAGGRLDPWAAKHAMRYGGALCLMLTVALIHPKVWMNLAWPIYGV